MPGRGQVAAVDVHAAHRLDPRVVAACHVHVLARKGRREDAGLDLELGCRPRAGIAVLAVPADEDRVLLGAVDAVAIGVDEPEIGQIGRPGADRRVPGRTVLPVDDPVAVPIGHRRLRGRLGLGLGLGCGCGVGLFACACVPRNS